MNELNHGPGKGDCDRTRKAKQYRTNYEEIKSDGKLFATVVLSHPLGHRRRFYYGQRHVARVGTEATSAKVG
jgi:hypothetical protein